MSSVTELELAAVRWLNAIYFDSLKSVRWKDLFAAISRDGLEVTDENGLIAHLVARGLVIKEIPVRPEHIPAHAWRALGLDRRYKYRASVAVLDAAASGAGEADTKRTIKPRKKRKAKISDRLKFTREQVAKGRTFPEIAAIWADNTGELLEPDTFRKSLSRADKADK